jgi:hypothetical protein
MLRHNRLEHRFVQYIPEQLGPGIIYISMEYATAAHLCCCGCGGQVITPFTPTDWKLTFDGETISLWPSIGNWNFPCRSHYIIRHNQVVTADPWSEKQVKGGRRRDRSRKLNFYDDLNRGENALPPTIDSTVENEKPGLWNRLKKRVRRKRK